MNVEPRRPEALDWLAAACAAALFVANHFVEGGNSPILKILGITSLMLALVFMVPPFFLLKKYGHPPDGAPFYETTTLVDRGVYGIVRHPQYLGYILLVLGFVALSQNPLTTIIGASASILFFLQALQEEEYCSRQLGAEYEAYAERVPRFNFVLGLIRHLRSRIRPS